MNDLIQRHVVIRLFTVATLAAVGWISLVKPARAQLDATNARLAQQHAEADAYEADPEERARINQSIESINSIAERLQNDLRRGTQSKSLLAGIEQIATERGVHIVRVDPQGSSQIELTNPNAPGMIISDRMGIEYSGIYDQVRMFLGDLQTELGVAVLESVRISPAAGQTVRGSVELQVFRFPSVTDGFKTGVNHVD